MAGVMRLLMVLSLVPVALFLAWCFAPVRPGGLDAHPRPATGYAEAMERVRALEAADGPDVGPDGRTRAYVHGARTARAVVFLHGLTNCPAQFDSLARLAYARGDNVLVPRLPRHGLSDRMTTVPAGITARELCDLTDRAVDAAAGLGERVTVVGLSVGGTLAAWAAQERGDVDRVVLVAPMLGVSVAPGWKGAVATRLAGVLPNVFVWWDPKLKENVRGPRHVYPRFATRAVAATLEVAALVRKDASAGPPRARSAALFVLEGDAAVDNRAATALVADWRRHGMTALRTTAFPGTLHLSHDLVDPEQVGADPALTYPPILAALDPTPEP